MKLRNKKTGEIEDLECITIFECSSKTLGISESIDEFYTIAELNDEWEDYKPKEPLLKDYPNEMEAIRAYGCSPLRFHRYARKGYSTFNFCTHYISFSRLFENLKDGETYSIAELCGEEDE